ncbi:hypothetical protein BO71DRAFT_357002, partial [Aspergillus ellipticus CBS 707.79]
MGPEDRLKMLFTEDESLLQLDTRLVVPEPVSPAEQEQTPAALQTSQPVEEQSATKEQPPIETTPQPIDKLPPPDGTFTPLLALAKYPYRRITGDLSERVADRFFNAGKFWERPWDMYYVYAPASRGSKCVLLTPTSQVNQFLQEINRELECTLTLPTDARAGLVLPFTEAYPQPIYVGHSTSRETKDRLEMSIPGPANEPLEAGMDEENAAFETMMDGAVAAIRPKKKASRQKQMMRQIHTRDTQELVRRLQQYFGLREMASPEEASMVAWDEPNPASGLSAIDVHQTVPHPFWREPLFVSLDVEANEHCHAQITEVGISVLDTRALVGVPPGDGGEQWRARIESRHLRVREYRHVVNHQFVVGCPGMFRFGESEWVWLRELGEEVRRGLQLDRAMSRRVVLVGHSLASDEQYLRQMGVVTGAMRDKVDTAEVFQLVRKEASVRSLGGVMAELGMEGWHLHNAGNDARYTMEVMVGMLMG